jgi:aminomethyltransferase
MFAIQGPNSVKLLQPLVDVELQWMTYYRGAQVQILHPNAKRQGGIISRTGYTGEDGFELSIGADIAPAVWEAIMEQGESLGLVPTGIGCRNTLRLEAGMPLYGHELGENIDPFQAGLGFACHLHGYDFPGRDALLKIKSAPPKFVRVGLEFEGRRAARNGCPVLSDKKQVGEVTSGSYSPTLEKSIAMAYVIPQAAKETELTIDIRGNLQTARIVELPFYNHKSNHKSKGKKK